MKYEFEKRRRRSIRLPGYDYGFAGLYFVTVCIENRECLLGNIADGEMTLNEAGHMVFAAWEDLPAFYAGVDTDHFVVMPNHFHGIVDLTNRDSTPVAPPRAAGPSALGPAPLLSLPDVVHRFKSLTTARYRDGVVNDNWRPFPGRFWQRNYYEHVIRNEDELNRIRQYIIDNPVQWAADRENPVIASSIRGNNVPAAIDEPWREGPIKP
jgi:REP element-mobilizing transposase RayT